MSLSPQTAFGIIALVHVAIFWGGNVIHKRGLKKKAEQQQQAQN